MIKVKSGALIREITEGALKWYKEAGWIVIEEKKEKKKNDSTDSEKTTTTQSDI